MQNDYKILYDKLQVYLDRVAISPKHSIEVNLFCTEIQDQIVDWKKEITNAK